MPDTDFSLQCSHLPHLLKICSFGKSFLVTRQLCYLQYVKTLVMAKQINYTNDSIHLHGFLLRG